jgi:phosphate transport system protein
LSLPFASRRSSKTTDANVAYADLLFYHARRLSAPVSSRRGRRRASASHDPRAIRQVGAALARIDQRGVDDLDRRSELVDTNGTRRKPTLLHWPIALRLPIRRRAWPHADRPAAGVACETHVCAGPKPIMAKQLPRQIDALKQKFLFVGTLVEEAIAKAISALINRDRNLANSVIEADLEIDRMEVDVEEEVLKILALYQPVAADLRFVVAVLKINNDLERMGDLAKNIAKRAVFLADCERFDLPVDFRPMATRVQSMVKQSLDALVNSDAALAQKVRDSDDEVDAMRANSEREIEQQIAQHPDRTDCLLRLSSVARHLERIADMATNIAEDVIYMVEGEIVRHHRTGESL